MFSELGAETGINKQMVHFVCVLVHRSCKCELCSTKVLNKVTSISPRPGLCPMSTHPSNESSLRGLSEYVFGIGGYNGNQQANGAFCMPVGPSEV